MYPSISTHCCWFSQQDEFLASENYFHMFNTVDPILGKSGCLQALSIDYGGVCEHDVFAHQVVSEYCTWTTE